MHDHASAAGWTHRYPSIVGPRDDFGWKPGPCGGRQGPKTCRSHRGGRGERYPNHCRLAVDGRCINLTRPKLIFATPWATTSPRAGIFRPSTPDVQFRIRPAWPMRDQKMPGSLFGISTGPLTSMAWPPVFDHDNKLGLFAAKPIGTCLAHINVRFLLGAARSTRTHRAGDLTGDCRSRVRWGRSHQRAGSMPDCESSPCHVDSPKVVIRRPPRAVAWRTLLTSLSGTAGAQGLITGAEYKKRSTIYTGYAPIGRRKDPGPQVRGGGFDKDFVQKDRACAGRDTRSDCGFAMRARPSRRRQADLHRPRSRKGRTVAAGGYARRASNKYTPDVDQTDFLIERRCRFDPWLRELPVCWAPGDPIRVACGSPVFARVAWMGTETDMDWDCAAPGCRQRGWPQRACCPRFKRSAKFVWLCRRLPSALGRLCSRSSCWFLGKGRRLHSSKCLRGGFGHWFFLAEHAVRASPFDADRLCGRSRAAGHGWWSAVRGADHGGFVHAVIAIPLIPGPPTSLVLGAWVDCLGACGVSGSGVFGSIALSRALNEDDFQPCCCFYNPSRSSTSSWKAGARSVDPNKLDHASVARTWFAISRARCAWGLVFRNPARIDSVISWWTATTFGFAGPGHGGQSARAAGRDCPVGKRSCLLQLMPERRPGTGGSSRLPRSRKANASPDRGHGVTGIYVVVSRAATNPLVIIPVAIFLGRHRGRWWPESSDAGCCPTRRTGAAGGFCSWSCWSLKPFMAGSRSSAEGAHVIMEDVCHRGRPAGDVRPVPSRSPRPSVRPAWANCTNRENPAASSLGAGGTLVVCDWAVMRCPSHTGSPGIGLLGAGGSGVYRGDPRASVQAATREHIANRHSRWLLWAPRGGSSSQGLYPAPGRTAAADCLRRGWSDEQRGAEALENQTRCSSSASFGLAMGWASGNDPAGAWSAGRPADSTGAAVALGINVDRRAPDRHQLRADFFAGSAARSCRSPIASWVGGPCPRGKGLMGRGASIFAGWNPLAWFGAAILFGAARGARPGACNSVRDQSGLPLLQTPRQYSMTRASWSWRLLAQALPKGARPAETSITK